MERCPCCNARLREAVICPRCQADLAAVIGSELSAQDWLSKAIEYCLESETEQSIEALGFSLSLKKTKMAVVFREYIIQQQCRDILEFLAQKNLLAAKQRLYEVRFLSHHSKQLQQSNAFTDYLLVNNQGNYSAY